MEYGHFDDLNREYVIDRVDVPVSWTNYIGIGDMYGVFDHTAGGYLLYKDPEHHRITRFRPNTVPTDGPGHYLYLRDEEDGDYWSISWQPVGKPREHYNCRHGLSYIKYLCGYSQIQACQTLMVAMDDPVEIWDLELKNESGRPRRLSVFSFAEFSFHQIAMDNQNFQMSLYAAGSSYDDGVIDYELHYEQDSHQFFTASFIPDSFDCLRDSFIGPYHSLKDPIALERGRCSNSFEKGGNHCASLHKSFTLAPGERLRLIFLLGEGDGETGARMRRRYSPERVDQDFRRLRDYWDERLSKLQISTPDLGMDREINLWDLYQSQINVLFSRFSSFIEVGGRTGLGYRDTAQDAMTLAHSDPEKCRWRLEQLLQALTEEGYGLHLFDPQWFQPQGEPAFRSPTVVPRPPVDEIVHGIEDACADDALWLVGAVTQYVKETGDLAFPFQQIGYAGGGHGSVYQHLERILDFSRRQVGANGICKGLRADWNDCLNLGGGESAMVSFLHIWALKSFAGLASALGRQEDAQRSLKLAEEISATCQRVLWDGAWYRRGITAAGRPIGTHSDREGRVHMESNTWAVICGCAGEERGKMAMDAVYQNLFTPYGLMLNAPCFTQPDDQIGFVTRVYPGLKENGAIFSHPNPWAWVAETVLGRGSRAVELYDALCPALQNDKIEVRQAEPYSYCQFVVGPDHSAFGRARHPFMTGSAGWAYYAATQYILGIRPDYDGLILDPCIPAAWPGFKAVRRWRGAEYHIEVRNPQGVEKGVRELYANGERVEKLPILSAGSRCQVLAIMG